MGELGGKAAQLTHFSGISPSPFGGGPGWGKSGNNFLNFISGFLNFRHRIHPMLCMVEPLQSKFFLKNPATH
jgi:hypothetical protein